MTEVNPLSIRQTEVLVLMAKGFSNNEIGDLIGISSNTVSDYVKAIFKLLNFDTRVECAVWACKQGLV